MTSIETKSPTSLECRSRLCKSLETLAQQTDLEHTALILSGGVDTCAILEAAALVNIKFSAAITVALGNDSPDEPFAKHAASHHGLPHHIIRMTAGDLVHEYLPQTVKLLQTWDGMTLRNSLVISAAMKEAKRLGMKSVVVGDGADELFGGYSFMWGCADDLDLWKKKRDDICKKWTFATTKLASSYGIVAYGPFMDKEFVSWAMTTTRKDCIGEKPIRLVLNGESIVHAVGKIVLREAFDTCASWRRKDPIEVGSGATIISKDAYWSEQLSDEEYEAAKGDCAEKGLVINSKEHLINLRTYIKVFGGILHPEKKRLGLGEGCAGCCFDVGEEMFCHLCGAWPAQRKSHSQKL
eukprot:scaffold6146_cov256-Chaetoceros_neogracile.AAC.11